MQNNISKELVQIQLSNFYLFFQLFSVFSSDVNYLFRESAYEIDGLSSANSFYFESFGGFFSINPHALNIILLIISTLEELIFLYIRYL